MKLRDVFNPNYEIRKDSRVWFFVAFLLMVLALCIAYSGVWNHGEVTMPVFDGTGTFKCDRAIRKAFHLSVAPSFSSVFWAVLIYSAAIVRKCVGRITNLPVLVLWGCNLLFIASLIEAFLPSESIKLFSFFGWTPDWATIRPQALLIITVLVSWLGVRALGGIAIMILMLAFLSRITDLNGTGVWGVLYLLGGVGSFFVQRNLSYMIPAGGRWNAFLNDLGVVDRVVHEDVKALGGAAFAGIKCAANAGVAIVAPEIAVASAVATTQRNPVGKCIVLFVMTINIGALYAGLFDGVKASFRDNVLKEYQELHTLKGSFGYKLAATTGLPGDQIVKESDCDGRTLRRALPAPMDTVADGYVDIGITPYENRIYQMELVITGLIMKVKKDGTNIPSQSDTLLGLIGINRSDVLGCPHVALSPKTAADFFELFKRDVEKGAVKDFDNWSSVEKSDSCIVLHWKDGSRFECEKGGNYFKYRCVSDPRLLSDEILRHSGEKPNALRFGYKSGLKNILKNALN